MTSRPTTMISKSSSTAEHTIYGNALNYTLAPVRVPLGVGFVSIGVHRATPGSSDAGVTLPDAAAPKESGP